MKNTRWNDYIFMTIRKRAVIYLIRQYKSNNHVYGEIYDYTYHNAMYAVNKQLDVFNRAYNIHINTNTRILNRLSVTVMSVALDLLFNKYHYGQSINFDRI